jgi:hypothetical protein
MSDLKEQAKEWYENSEYLYDLDEHDEGGYLGINENKVAEMLVAFTSQQLEKQEAELKTLTACVEIYKTDIAIANKEIERLKEDLFITKEIVSSVQLDEEGAKRIYHEKNKLKEENQKLREIANEVLWWETCPDKMKEEINSLLETTEPKDK